MTKKLNPDLKEQGSAENQELLWTPLKGWRRRGGAERPESLGLEPRWGQKIRAGRLGSFLPLLFGFPEFLRLFPRKLSPRLLSAPRGQRSVLKVAWDDVTRARALG